MKTMVLATALALLSVTVAHAADCAKADGDLARAICNSAELTKADAATDVAYKAALKAVGPKMAKVLKASTAAWDDNRYEDCEDTSDDEPKPEDVVACLIADAHDHTAYLTGMPLDGPGYGEAMLPQVMTGADGVFEEYMRFTAPKSAASKAFNAALDKLIKDTRLAKTEDHVSDWLSMQLTYASPELISVNFDLSKEEGFAHPMMSDLAVNIDGKTGKEFLIADLLDDAGIKTIEDNCAGQLKDYIAAGTEGSDVRAENVKGIAGTLSAWSFGAKEATLHYTEYDADAYHACTIGYDVLKPLAKASFPLPR